MTTLDPMIFEMKHQQLTQTRANLYAELSSVQAQLSDVDARLVAFRTVLEECSDDSDRQSEVPEIIVSARLQELDLEETLVMLANQKDGELNVYQVRPILMEKGLLRGESRAISIRLYETLSNSERFEQAGSRGRWKLVTQSPHPPMMTVD